MAAKHYQELIAWQKAMDLVVLVYRATAGFPREEIFGLTSQVRKAAVSIPSNIAEVKGGKPLEISSISSRSPEARFKKWKRKCSSLGV